MIQKIDFRQNHLNASDLKLEVSGVLFSPFNIAKVSWKSLKSESKRVEHTTVLRMRVNRMDCRTTPSVGDFPYKHMQTALYSLFQIHNTPYTKPFVVMIEY